MRAEDFPRAVSARSSRKSNSLLFKKNSQARIFRYQSRPGVDSLDLKASRKLILSHKMAIGCFQIPSLTPPKCPIENQCNFSNCEKISYLFVIAYQLGLDDDEGNAQHAFQDNG